MSAVSLSVLFPNDGVKKDLLNDACGTALSCQNSVAILTFKKSA